MSFSLVSRSKKIILFQIIAACLIGLFLLSTVKLDEIAHIPSSLSYKSFKGQSNKEYPYTIVTASSANHLCSLENFLYSLGDLRHEMDSDQYPRVVVYNIGVNRTQLPILDKLQSHGLMDELIHFDFEHYPRFWDVALSAGEYAWKTGIVNDARIRYGGILVWLDSGNQVSKEFLLDIPHTIRDELNGFWSPKSDHNMQKWTHPGMFDFFGANMTEYRYKKNCNGAAIGFDTTNQTVVNEIIIPWFECGLQKNCIAPSGSNRTNHRQDQAVLTYLVYLNGQSCSIPPRDYNIQTHRDQSCRSQLMELDLQNELHHPSTIDTVKWERVDTVDLYNHPEWRYYETDVPPNLRRPSILLLE
ncbi:hypothetical protein BDB01DRAFT_787512 [Pilobolus umbonatus]|nr:hypothetical protein BDB01DRAFT_787512 [Pilobolus umbonatus]